MYFISLGHQHYTISQLDDKELSVKTGRIFSSDILQFNGMNCLEFVESENGFFVLSCDSQHTYITDGITKITSILFKNQVFEILHYKSGYLATVAGMNVKVYKMNDFKNPKMWIEKSYPGKQINDVFIKDARCCLVRNDGAFVYMNLEKNTHSMLRISKNSLSCVRANQHSKAGNQWYIGSETGELFLIDIFKGNVVMKFDIGNESTIVNITCSPMNKHFFIAHSPLGLQS